MASIKCLAIKRRIVDNDQLASEVQDSFGVFQGDDCVVLVKCLYPENEIQTQREIAASMTIFPIVKSSLE
jgi:hypothetical protein